MVLREAADLVIVLYEFVTMTETFDITQSFDLLLNVLIGAVCFSDAVHSW